MRKTLACLTLLMSTVAFADPGSDKPLVVEVQSAVLTVKDSPPLNVTEGTYLNKPAVITLSKEVTRLKTENNVLKSSVNSAHTHIAVGIGVALLVGVGAGFAVAHASSR